MTFLFIMGTLIIGTWIGMALLLFKTRLVDEEE